MESYRWNKRPLLVFAPNPESAVARDQRAALTEATADFRDRDMVHVEVLGQAVWIDQTKSDSVDADLLREEYGVANSETVVLLIGKDGGVKLRRDAAINPRDLYSLIDTMPMRQREIREDVTTR